MSYKINIRNQANDGWVNLLQAQYMEILDTNSKYAASTVEAALEEIYDGASQRTEHLVAPGVSDDSTAGYRTGDIWVNTNDDEVEYASFLQLGS